MCNRDIIRMMDYRREEWRRIAIEEDVGKE
jgi:hypothetical protein